MIEITVRDHRTGKVRTFKGSTALVLMREQEDVTVCASGNDEEDQKALCELLMEAHDHVNVEMVPPEADSTMH